MNVILTKSADEFAERATPLLGSRVEHNILATVLQIAQRRSPDGALFGFVEGAHGEIAGAALRLPPRRLLASVMDQAAGAALTEAWLAADPGLPGVAGPRDSARCIAREWELRTGGAYELAMGTALHALDRVTDPPRPAAGALREPTASERELMLEWVREFITEEGLADDPAAMLDSRRLHVWDDGGPVSLVASSPPVAAAVRIGPVYTPPANRRRGYASSAVAGASRVLLQSGARQCLLFTDLSNPTSNRIYAAVGYRRVAAWDELAFRPQ